MSAFRWLPPEVLRALQTALVDAGLDQQRTALAQGIHAHFWAGLPLGTSPAIQAWLDLNRLNEVRALADGSVPLAQYLSTAAFLIRGGEEAPRFERALQSISARLSHAPEPRALSAGEINEELLFEDDLVAATFLRAGAEAARSVALIRVPQIEDGAIVLQQGKPLLHLGTAWLVASDLAITNHHVLLARTHDEKPASEADLRAQAEKAELDFDFDAETLRGVRIAGGGLVAFSEPLDYAIIRLAEKIDRAGLTTSDRRLSVRAGERCAVNIVQHPLGGPKKVAMRNNLVTEADEIQLRYFAGTQNGSSGSPVFDDRWRVVALHASSRFVENVRFQGRPVAWVNRGIQIAAIKDDVRAKYSTLAAELGW